MSSSLQNVLDRSRSVATSLTYPLRVALAATIALSLSTALGLEEPHWAAWTVISVGLPIRGDSLRKSLNRLLGTLIGVTAAAAFLLLLRHTPYLLLLALAVWLGLCVYVGSLLRGFRSYAGLLAGYTAVIVSVGGLAAGHEWQTICVSRTTNILIGIFGGAVASLASTHTNTRALFLKRLQATTSLVSQWACQRIQAGLGTEEGSGVAASPRVRSIFSNIVEMDAEVSNLIAEVPRLWRLRGALRDTTGQLLEIVFAARNLDRQLRQSAEGSNTQSTRAAEPQPSVPGVEIRDVVRTSVGELTSLLEQVVDALALAVGEDLTLRATNLQRFAIIASEHKACTPAERRVLDAEIAIATHLSHILSIDLSPEAVRKRQVSGSRTPLVRYQDRLRAIINGLRAFLVLAGCGTAWLMLTWSTGAIATIFAAILIALYATKEEPQKTSLSFLVAGLEGAASALIFRWLYLTLGWNRPELILAEGLIILVAVGVGQNLSGRFWTTGFGILFLSLADPTGLMSLNLPKTLEEAAGIITGVSVATAAYFLLPPAGVRLALQKALLASPLKDPTAAFHAMLRRMDAGVSRSVWSSQQFDWLMQTLIPIATEEQVVNTIRMLDIQVELLRLRDAVANVTLQSEAYLPLRRRLGELQGLPLGESLERLDRMRSELKSDSSSEHQEALRAEASIAALIVDLRLVEGTLPPL